LAGGAATSCATADTVISVNADIANARPLRISITPMQYADRIDVQPFYDSANKPIPSMLVKQCLSAEGEFGNE
jgi:hypothetical protein